MTVKHILSMTKIIKMRCTVNNPCSVLSKCVHHMVIDSEYGDWGNILIIQKQLIKFYISNYNYPNLG